MVRLIRSRIVRTGALMVCVVIGIGIVRSVYTLSQKKGIIVQRQQVLTELKVKNSQLRDELREATSPAFIEQAARDKLGLVREGETVIIMDTSRGENTNNSETPREISPWKQWWTLFF